MKDNTRLFKPWLIIPSKVLAALLLLVSLVVIGVGIYVGFFESRGFESATATIVRIDEEDDVTSAEPNAKSYTTTVTYTVDGKAYTEVLDTYTSSYKVGKEVKIKYDPANPATIHADSPGITIYLIGLGVLLLAGSIFTIVKNSRQRREVQEEKYENGEPRPVFSPSRQLAEEREVYFLTDLGTAKGTCHLEDGDRNLLYEAQCDKFSLVGDSLYTFVDWEHNVRQQYSVGKTLTQSSDGLFVLDNHSSFLLDGRDIWKTLHENGVRIETGLDGIKWTYTLYRDEEPIARIVSTNKKVHEEDEGGILSKVPFPGFFRIWTREENLDVIFLTAFAIGRTDMMLYN